jgi:hypothetical protein
LELYSANHAETVEQLLDWPWRRFERFYEAFTKRQVVEVLEGRKNAMISALWSNSNWDDDKGTRASAIEELEANLEEALFAIFNGVDEEEDIEISEDNPFFASTRKAMDQVIASTGDFMVDDDTSVRDVAEYSKHIDQ